MQNIVPSFESERQQVLEESDVMSSQRCQNMHLGSASIMRLDVGGGDMGISLPGFDTCTPDPGAMR